jgi:hypothetical protein
MATFYEQKYCQPTLCRHLTECCFQSFHRNSGHGFSVYPNSALGGICHKRLVHFACSFVQEPNNELYLKALEMTEKVLSALTLFMCVCHLVGGWYRVQGLGRRETKFAYTHWILRLFLEGAALEIQAKIGHSCCCTKEMYVPSVMKSLL